jgi:hypothetical protein
MSRREASDYLKAAWGVTRSPKTLSNLAVQGVLRPAYDGCRPLYSKDMLDAFAGSIIARLTSRPANGRREKQAA